MTEKRGLTMICKNCGEYFSDQLRECPTCGTPVQPMQAPPAPPVMRQSAQPPAQPPHKNSNAPVAVLFTLAAVLVVGAAVALVVFLMRSNDAPSDDAPAPAAQTATVPNENAAEPETVVDINSVRVPDLSGLNYEQARKELISVGLVPDKELVSSDQAEGMLVSQSPEANTFVKKGSMVTIRIAKPHPVENDNDPPAQESHEQSSAAPAPSPALRSNQRYVIPRQYVTLRDAPTRTGRPVTTINRGEVVTIGSQTRDFTYVTYNGMHGYVLTEFLSTDKNDVNTGTGTVNYLQDGDYVYCRAHEFASLRPTPSTSATRLLKINRDERAEYLGETGEWFYVRYAGQRGYVLKAYFSPQYDAPIVSE